jgi:hypothetical protein
MSIIFTQGHTANNKSATNQHPAEQTCMPRNFAPVAPTASARKRTARAPLPEIA